jgi:hypothetical protein
VRLAHFFGTSAVNLQSLYEIRIAKQKLGKKPLTLQFFAKWKAKLL